MARRVLVLILAPPFRPFRGQVGSPSRLACSHLSGSGSAVLASHLLPEDLTALVSHATGPTLLMPGAPTARAAPCTLGPPAAPAPAGVGYVLLAAGNDPDVYRVGGSVLTALQVLRAALDCTRTYHCMRSG